MLSWILPYSIDQLFHLEETPFTSREFSRQWFLALGTYGVGDIVTTIALIKYSPIVEETNPIIQIARLLFGVWGFVGLKLIVFLALIVVGMYGAHTRDRVLFYFPPIALSIAGTFGTVLNIRLMLG